MKPSQALSIFALLLLACSSLTAQLALSVTTDRESYSYGDTIQVRVTITNTTDTVVTKYASSTCFLTFGFDSFPFMFNCTADEHEFRFSPHGWLTRIWNLAPSEWGLPQSNGEHTVRGFGAGLADSITIQAPKYFGGQLALAYQDTISELFLQSLREDLDATVLSCDTIHQLGYVFATWQVSGHSIDSIIQVYSGDPRFHYVARPREVFYDETLVSSVPPTQSVLNGFQLSRNYPNPFNPSTQVDLVISRSSHVSATVHDATGRLIATLADREYDAGRHVILFDGSGLASGVYYLHLFTRDFQQVRRLLLLK